MSTYTKPHLSFVEQLQLLKSRGLIVTNDELAVEHLNRLGYYRLSGYLYPCRKLIDNPDITTGRLRAQRYDEFMPGAQF
jgi:abortive infection bacteriophage resistance protein